MFDLNPGEKKIFRKLNNPAKVQDFLDKIPINFEKHGDTLFSPRTVLEKNRAHCIEGAMLASAIFWYHGEKPLLLHLQTIKRDFNHVVALFRKKGYWGAVAKSNHAVLMYRDPIYRTVRELAISYFHEYFLEDGEKTLRSYSDPFDLSRFGTGWITAKGHLWDIDGELEHSPHKKLVPSGIALRKADPIQMRAGRIAAYRR